MLGAKEGRRAGVALLNLDNDGKFARCPSLSYYDVRRRPLSRS